MRSHQVCGLSVTPTVVLNVVGLTPGLLQHAPNLQALAKNGAVRPLTTVLPAVTTTVQSTMLTGLPPRDHGIVANGWYFRDLSEIWLWRQSNRLVGGEKVWEAAKRRDPAFTCAKLFWWYNMYASVDFAVTPRPMYLADGRKLPDIHTHPAELRDELQGALGEFPLFRFWGPGADIESSRWIARSALHVLEQKRPTLTLVYLPHLDYDLQRFGPNHPGIPAQVAAVDALCGPLIEKARALGAHVVVAVRVRDHRGIAPGARQSRAARGRLAEGATRTGSRTTRCRGLRCVRRGGSPTRARVRGAPGTGARGGGLPEFAARCGNGDDETGKRAAGLDHPRSGELVAVAKADSWFTYYHFLDDARAPDFARTVEIHRKPGYDPAELLIDPTIRFPKLAVASRLARKALGMRYLMDVIGLDATVVRGSHGRPTDREEDGPLFITTVPELLARRAGTRRSVKQLLLDHVFPVAH